MGDDLSLDGRNAVRTPMQWSDDCKAGFSHASPEQLIRPVIQEGVFGYPAVNLQAQMQDPGSLLNRMERLIRVRRSCPEIGKGDCGIAGFVLND